MIDRKFIEMKLSYIQIYYQELTAVLDFPEKETPQQRLWGIENLIIKYFPKEFAQKVALVIGLRDRLVHRYEKIDIDIPIKETLKDIEDFKEYATQQITG